MLPVLLAGTGLSQYAWVPRRCSPPPDYPDPDSFCWEKYLEETGASAVPTWAFKVVSWLTLSPELNSGRHGALGQLGCGPAPPPPTFAGPNFPGTAPGSLLGASALLNWALA